jgi:hypothetical protein
MIFDDAQRQLKVLLTDFVMSNDAQLANSAVFLSSPVRTRFARACSHDQRPGCFRWKATATLFLLCSIVECVSLGVACAETPPQQRGHHELDFWIGDWDVLDQQGHKLGTNRIEEILNGAALLEHWRDVDGHEGKSWFYFYQQENRWKQIWVTDEGFVKEKAFVEKLPDGSTRFRGEIPLHDGRKILDQTTLTPLPDGSVRQVIERSEDGAKTWKISFDAIYRRK